MPSEENAAGEDRTVFVAWLINLLWPFPQPWGLMVAATISLAVQLASPWAGERRGRRNLG